MPLVPTSDRARLVAGLAVLGLVLRAPTFTNRMFDPDEAAIGVQAMVLRDGGTMYVDIFDRKPPLPPMIYSWSFQVTGDTSLWPMRVFVTVLLVAAALLVASDLHRRHGPRVAAVGGVLTIFGAMSMYPADAGAANYAHFALLPGLAAVVWSRRAGWRWAILAGAALGVAVLCRQSWILGLPALAASAALHNRQRIAAALTSALAAMTVIASVGLVVPIGAFWEWNFANSPGFVFASAGIGSSVQRIGLTSLGFIAFHLTIVVAAGFALVRRASSGRGWKDNLDLCAWLLCGLAAVAAGFRFFGHYWLQILPPLVLLAAPVVGGLRGRATKLAAVGVSIPALVAWALLFVPGSFRDRPDPTDLAEAVTELTGPSDRVLVWGSYPEVLLEADRPVAGRLVHTDFVTGRSGGREDPELTLQAAVPGAFDLMLDDLRRNPPQVVLDTSPNADLGYRNYPLSTFPELETFVDEGYRLVTVIDDIRVLVRIDQ